MDVILDTCALLSLAGVADRKLSQTCVQTIEEADSVYISACSCFEICLKHKRGHMKFPKRIKPETFWKQCVAHYGLTELSVSAEDFASAVQLPEHHADPFDRIIIAQATRSKSTLISYDKWFQAYDVKLLA